MKFSSLLHLLLHVISILYQSDAFSMKMHPIDSPHLQVLPQSFTAIERHQFLRNISVSRAFYANNKNVNSLAPNSIRSKLPENHGYYVTELTFGRHDPVFSPNVILELSSNQTWIQCSKCEECFKLKGSFPVEDSTSYSQMILKDERCDTKMSYEGSCGFEAWFGKAHAKGYIGTDIFVFDTAQEKPAYFPNIAFGCGIHNTGFDFEDQYNKIAGIHGLSPGPRSFLNQLSQEIKGLFSYCVPSDAGSTTLSFGDDAKISKGFLTQAQTISMNPDARYHLYLAAITLDDVRLPIDPSVFELNEKDYSSGFFIDPSTPHTMLHISAYVVLQTAVAAYYAEKKWLPHPGLLTDYDMCVTFVPRVSTPTSKPKVTFNFIKSKGESGEVELELENAFHEAGPFGAVATCLAMGSTTGPSIFGALQQSGHQFSFDVPQRKLSIVKNDC